MNAEVDLKQLAVRRTPEAVSARPRRRALTRYVLPSCIMLGFVALVGWAARTSFLPSRAVTVMPVLTTLAAVETEGTPLFQAAGVQALVGPVFGCWAHAGRPSSAAPTTTRAASVCRISRWPRSGWDPSGS